MTTQPEEPLGRVDDETEEATPSSDHEGGAAAAGEYDAAEGSPGDAHPTGETYPDEAVRYDDPEGRPRVQPD